jgi:hypothetical protein
VLTHLAEIYTIVGEPDLAIQTLRPLLAIPSWISRPELESDPTWAPLRPRPRLVNGDAVDHLADERERCRRSLTV